MEFTHDDGDIMGRSSCFCRSVFATNVEIGDFTFTLSQWSSLVFGFWEQPC